MASVVKILDSDVANGATVTVNYSNDMSYPLSTGHYVNINNNQYDLADGEIGVALGDTSAVITNNTGRKWLKGHKLSVEFVEPENITIKKVSSAQYSSISPKKEDVFYAIENNNLVGTIQIEDYTAVEISEVLKQNEVNPAYHFYGFHADEADGDQFFDRSGNGNDAERGANLSATQMFANTGYISTVDPTGGSEDSVLRMPNINLDYAGGEKLIIFWRGIITPEGSNRRFIGDGEGSYAGFGIRVNSDGKLSFSITDGTTAAFSGNSTSTAFEAGVPHDILVAIDGESNTYGFIIDGEYDALTTDYIALAGGSGTDTRNANTVNIGTAFPASEGSSIGIATQTRRLDILKLGASYDMPELSVFRDVARQARINPMQPITRAAF